MKIRTRITAAKFCGQQRKTAPFFNVYSTRLAKVRPNSEIEKLAEKVAAEFGTVCVKLSDLKPKIDQIRSYFQASIRGSVTLAGWPLFREFCEKRLHRCEQTVYKMLASDTKKREPGKTIPKAPPARPKPWSLARTLKGYLWPLPALQPPDTSRRKTTGIKRKVNKAKADFSGRSPTRSLSSH